VIELAVPELHGEVCVQLSTEVMERGTLLASQRPEVRWSFPNFT
jgi:hypothetical protein